MIVKNIVRDDLMEPVVTIESQKDDPVVKRILEALEGIEGVLIGFKDERKFPIASDDVYYCENIEDKGLIYTKNDLFDCRYRLYEIESISPFFVRVNKSTVLNIKKIKSFRSTINAKLEATLLNGDRIEISRKYVPVLKQILGGIS
ncbi:MAG: LytTR family transcriptional regulator DNA-binding domain-containing protein [Acholeplasmataceae bacterium]|nr:LytTR family transcriptional regulator DNA-binding domain-containing protein [Acholeplasmataceae bacterium]